MVSVTKLDPNSFKIAELREIAKILDIEQKERSKAAIVKMIMAANPKASALEQAIAAVRGGTQKSSKKKRKPKITSDSSGQDYAQIQSNISNLTQMVSRLELRLSDLENQVRYILSKLGTLELKSVASKPLVNGQQLEEVKRLLKEFIPPSTSRTVDEITSVPALQHFPIAVIEQALLDLIDDEVFDVSEGASKLKLAGNIGRLIRR